MPVTRRALLPVFGAVAAVTLLGIIVVYMAGLRVNRANLTLLQREQIRDTLEDTLSNLRNAETEQRGFLLTSQEEYLEPYRAAVARTQADLQDLERWGQSGALPAEPAATITRLGRANLERLERNLQLRRQEGPEAAVAAVRSGAGLHPMDELRQRIGQVEAQETAKTLAIQQQRDRANQLRTISAAVMALVTVLFVGWAYWRTRRMFAAQLEAEEAVRASEERFRALVAASSDVVYRMSPDWSEARYIHGRGFVADTETSSRTWLQKYVPPEEQAQLMAAINQAIRTKGTFELELRVLRVDGSLGWTLSRAVPIVDDSGDIVEWFGAARDITQRKEAEEALRESRKRVQADLDAMIRLQKLGALSLREANPETILTEVVDVAIAISGADFGNLQLLDAATGDLRIVAQRGFPQPWLDFWNSVSKGKGACGTALERRERIIVEDIEHSPIFAGTPALEVQLRAGVRAVQSTPLVSRSGKPVGMFSTHFRQPHRPDERAQRLLDLLARQAADIIERAQAEEALRQSEERLRLAQQAAGIGSFEWNIQVDINTWSAELEAMYGLAPGGFGGREADWEQLVHPEDRAAAIGAVNHALESDQAVEGEWRVCWPDGSVHWILGRFQVYKDAAGRALRLAGANIDITERKRTEEALRHALVDAQHFRQAVENVPVCVFMKDLQCRYTYANKATLEQFGLPTEEMIGCDDSRLFSAQAARWLREVDLRVLKGEQTCEEFDTGDDPSGRRVCVESKTPIYADPEGRTICGLLGIATDITERKLAEERLEQRVHQRTVDLAKALTEAQLGRATLDALLESIPEGIAIVDAADYKLRRVSRYMAEMLGVGVGTLEGKTADEYLKRWQTLEADGTTPVRVADLPLAQAIREGRTVEGRELMVCRSTDGAKIPTLCSAAPIRDRSGQITGGIAVWRDITDRKQAEEALRRSEARWNAAIESFAQGAIIATEDEQIIYWNPAAREMHGFTRPDEGIEPLEKAPFQLWTPDGKRMLAADEWPMRRIKHGETVRNVELRLRRPDQGWEKVFSYSGAMVDTAGGERLILLTCQDLTELRSAEHAVRESESRFRTMADAIPQLAWTAHADGYVYWLNRRMYEYTGATPEQIEGWSWQSVIDPKTLPAVLQRWSASIATGELFEMEFPIRGADGEFRRFLTRVVPLKDAQGQVVQWFGTNTDVEDLTRAEEALRQVNQTLEQQVQQRTEALAAAKLSAEEANAAKDHFLAVLSHELRTPLTPVLPVLDELAGRVPEEAREDVEMARRNVELEARLIDDLLDVTRIARGKIELHRESVELETILRRAAEVCAPDIEARRLHFGITTEGGPYPVEADPARLQQVFWNLIKNAIKFTPHGGCIGVRCIGDGAGHVLAEVHDSGMGIEPAALARIFNAFEQVDRSVTRQFGGLGLGLAISKALVELHGGAISAHSEGKGKGATFRVRLPIHRAATAKPVRPEPGMATATQTPAVTRPLEILLVEDHGDTARIMRRMLQNRGHRVETAGDVATALELARGKPFDLLLSDLGLPDGSGVELMQELREHGRVLPGIALSGYGQEEDIRRSHEAGFREHLTKPVNIGQLEAAIGRVTEG